MGSRPGGRILFIIIISMRIQHYFNVATQILLLFLPPMMSRPAALWLLCHLYSRPSMVRILMARLPSLTTTRFFCPYCLIYETSVAKFMFSCFYFTFARH